MVSFFTRNEWSDGMLKERMDAEGLPAVLRLKHSNNGRIERIEYTCSPSLAIAMMNAGADLEFVTWDAQTLEYRRLNMPR